MDERLARAFKEILSHLSEDKLAQFIDDINPKVIYIGSHSNACVFAMHVPPKPKEETGLTQLNALHLSASIEDVTDEELRDILAHEIAHLMLGHQVSIGFSSEGEEQCREIEADTLSVSWGFSPCYGPDGKKEGA